MTANWAAPPGDYDVEPADLIHYLQQALITAQARRESAGILPLFEVESLEIEMHVSVTRRHSSGGKFDIKVLAITEESKIDELRTHTVRLRLKAIEGSESTTAQHNGRRPSMRKSQRSGQ